VRHFLPDAYRKYFSENNIKLQLRQTAVLFAWHPAPPIEFLKINPLAY